MVQSSYSKLLKEQTTTLAVKGANKNISSGSQGMQRQEESNNEQRLRQHNNTNQNGSQLFSMKRACTEM
jgi:hypothetical protein